jgi:stringent starvation protein B
MTQLLPPKKEVALAILERSNVDIYLDPRAKGVVVPPQFKKEPRLILKIGLNMPVPIPDLRLDDESMSCTLSFSRSPFYCVVPWPSVFAMVGDDGRGMVWPDDVPQELAVRVETERAKAEESEAARPSAGAGRRTKREAAQVAAPPKGKRAGGKKKKDDAARPQLVAVPPAERADRVSPLPRAPAAPAQQRTARDGGARPKRELPPYLRVVK